MSSRVESWRSREVKVVLPRTAMEAIWRRADQWGVDRGGRFDVYPEVILLWDRGFTVERNEPVGVFAVRWRDPDPESATIDQIAWNPGAGGTEEHIWLALELLAGRGCTIRP